MKNLLPILAVVFVFVAIAVAVSVGIVWRMSGSLNQPIGVILVYEIDRQGGRVDPASVNMKALTAAIDRRINPSLPPRGHVRSLENGQIEIGVYGNDPKTVERIELLMEATGTLEFRILANRRDHTAMLERAEREDETDRFLSEVMDGQLLAWWVPVAPGNEDSIEYPEILTRTREADGQERLEVLVVNSGFDVTGDYLSRATPSVDQTGTPSLIFEFNPTGAQLFGGLTGSNLPAPTGDFTRKLGIILNGQLVSAPAIQSTIFNRGEITGSFTKDEVQDLADILTSGAFPATLRQVERRTVAGQK